jgi:hypothetical protein
MSINPSEESQQNLIIKFSLIDAYHFKISTSQKINELIPICNSMSTKSVLIEYFSWSFEISEYNVLSNMLNNGLFQIEPLISPLRKLFVNRKNNILLSLPFRINSDIFQNLWPFQKAGVLTAIYKEGRIILADEVGKRLQVQIIAIKMTFKINKI